MVTYTKKTSESLGSRGQISNVDDDANTLHPNVNYAGSLLPCLFFRQNIRGVFGWLPCFATPGLCEFTYFVATKLGKRGNEPNMPQVCICSDPS